MKRMPLSFLGEHAHLKKVLNSCMLAIVVFLVSLTAVSAQVKTITGNIKDTGGNSLPGVSVFVKGTTNGTISDIDGNYALSNVPAKSVLVFSFVGMHTKEVEATNATIDVTLEEDVVGLEEVVAIGYGVVKKRDITGSVSSISAEDLTIAPVTSLDAGMQGKIAGVTIQNTTGAPGQKMKIRVRGGNSINYSNEPLYVIDGFIGADITTINPSDIATIDILKDASATAVYGSRGANGVILITTNAPKAGDMKVSFDANVGVGNMVNEYEILPAGEAAELMNLQDDYTDAPHSFTDEEVSYFKQNGGTNWVDLVTRQSIKQNYTLNVNGGSDKLQYFFSANYLDDEGVIKNSFYKRASVRSNISGKLSDWIDFKFNTYGVHTSSQLNGRQTGGLNNTIGNAVSFPQFWNSRDENGDFIDPTTYPQYGRYQAGSTASPEMANRQNQETFGESLTSNLDLTFKFTDHITLLVSNSGRFNTGFSGSRDLEDYVTYSRTTLSAQQNYNRGSSWVHTDILSYANTFGAHDLKVSGIYEFSKNMWRSNQTKVSELSTLGNEWDVLDNGVPTLATSKFGETKMRSFMGRLNYSYADKYLLTASIRRDGASVFNKENRWGNFPSAALAWRVSEEDFIKSLDFVHNLKVRAGVGVTGNTAIGAYATQSQFSNAFQYIYWVPDGLNSITGKIPGVLTNPNIEWEKTTQYNAGIDVALFDGKVSAVVDLYSKLSTDVIIAKTVPSFTGVTNSSYTSNFADISNKGIELGIDYVIKNTNDFNWNANFNFTRNLNTVEKLNASNSDQIFVSSEDALGIWMGGTNSKFVVQEGESMGALFGLKALGLWQENEAEEAAKYGSHPGEVKYEDVLTVDTDGDEIPDAVDGQINDSDRQIIGYAAPDFTFGFGTNLEYKGFDLAVQFIGSVGNEIYNYSRVILDREILNPSYRDRWSSSNTSSTQQIMPWGTDYSRSFVTSQYIEDGSFLKISNVALGYTLPKNICKQMRLSNVRVYVSADNVYTFTNYSGLDPESSSTTLNSDSQAGVDAFSYPLLRTVTGGIKVTF